MAEVIYSAPAPGRPNPFYNLGQGISQGMLFKMERDAAIEARDEEERRKREAEAEQAKRSLSAFKSVMNPATTGMEPGGEGAFASILTTTPEQRAAETPQQRLFALPAEEFAALSSSPMMEQAMRAAGFGPEQKKSEFERMIEGLPEEEQQAARQGRIQMLTEGSRDNTLVDIVSPDGERRTVPRADPGLRDLLSEGWVTAGKERTASSSMGKLKADLDAGYITPAQYNQGVRKLTALPQPTPRAPDQRERKIQSLIEQGLPRATASNIVDGNVDIKLNEATGRVVLTDLVTNTVTELPIGSDVPDRVVVPADERLYDMADDGVAGLAATIAEAGSRVTGQVGLPVAEETTRKRQAIRTAQQDLIRSLSINPRFPVAEQERIRKEVDINPGAFDSPKSLQSRMKSIDKSLRTRLAQAQRDAGDANLPEELRSSQAQNASAIQNFLDVMGAPQEATSEDEALIQKWMNR